MPGRVVDASVLGAVAFVEPRFAEAVALLRGYDLYAPPLLAYELTSVARKKAVIAPDTARTLTANLGDALSMDIRWVDVDHVEVLGLALSTGLSTYDACYLHVSRRLGLPIATFDERLLRAARRRP